MTSWLIRTFLALGIFTGSNAFAQTDNAVRVGAGIQNLANEVQLSTTGDYNGAAVSGLLDSSFRLYRKFKIPAPGYGVATFSAEITCDQSGQGGECVGGYFVANGSGLTGSGAVHDTVGVSATARKNNNGWYAAIHADVYDLVPGGTALGLNIEFPQTQIGTDTIGINIQPNATASGIVGIQLQNPGTSPAYRTLIAAASAQAASVMELNPSMLVPGKGIPVMIGGQQYYLQVTQTAIATPVTSNPAPVSAPKNSFFHWP